MKKKGQLPLFLISGIFLLLGFLFIATFEDFEKDIIVETPLSVDSLDLFVETCLEDNLKKATLFVGLQGGYYKPNSNSIGYHDFLIPIYFQNNNSYAPTLGKIETELSLYIEENIDSCLGDFSTFKAQGLDVEARFEGASVLIGKDQITATLDYPIAIINEKDRIDANSFSTSIDFNFQEKHSIVENVVEVQHENNNHMPLTYISELASQNRFTFDLVDTGSSVIVYVLVFEDRIDNEQFVYAFAHNYEEESR